MLDLYYNFETFECIYYDNIPKNSESFFYWFIIIYRNYGIRIIKKEFHILK